MTTHLGWSPASCTTRGRAAARTAGAELRPAEALQRACGSGQVGEAGGARRVEERRGEERRGEDDEKAEQADIGGRGRQQSAANAVSSARQANAATQRDGPRPFFFLAHSVACPALVPHIVDFDSASHISARSLRTSSLSFWCASCLIW